MRMGCRRVCAVALAAVALSAFCASPAAAREVYVASYINDTVSVIESATNQVVRTIPIAPDSGP